MGFNTIGDKTDDATLEALTSKMKEKGFEEVPGTKGGVLKKILQVGQGSKPIKGDKVGVHYTGSFFEGGKVFDSSRARPSTFDFEMGGKRVIKGWEEGVQTMRPGESCILRCRPDFAYGARGRPPAIPPNAILDFEVELCTVWSKDPNAKAPPEQKQKQVLTADQMTPEQCIAEAEMYKAEGTTAFKQQHYDVAVLNWMRGSAYVRHLVQGDLPASEGEASQKEVSKEKEEGADGEGEASEKEDSKEKEDGEDGKAEDGDTAEVRALSKQLAELQKMLGKGKDEVSPETKATAKALCISLELNLAFAYLKQNKPVPVAKHCRMVLALDPTNVKAHYRQAQAHIMKRNFDEALPHLQAAHDGEPKNKEVAAELKKCTAAIEKASARAAELRKLAELPAKCESPVHSRDVESEVLIAPCSKPFDGPDGRRCMGASEAVPQAQKLLEEWPLVSVPVDNLKDHCHMCFAPSTNHTHTFTCEDCETKSVFCCQICQKIYQEMHSGAECQLLDCLTMEQQEGSTTQELRLAIRLLATGAMPTVEKMSGVAPMLPPADAEDYDAWSDALVQAVSVTGNRELLPADDEQAKKLMVHCFYVIASCTLPIGGEAPKHKGYAIYENGSIFNHSCRPNAAMHITTHGLLTVASIGPLPQGEEITIAYGTDLYRPVTEGRRRLFGHFKCSCPRCLSSETDDPPSGDALLTAFQCQGCRQPLAKLGGSCPSCGASCDPGACDPIDQVHKLLARIDATASRTPEQGGDMCSSFLSQRQWLHPKHHLLCRIHFWAFFGKYSENPAQAVVHARHLIGCMEDALAISWPSDMPPSTGIEMLLKSATEGGDRDGANNLVKLPELLPPGATAEDGDRDGANNLVKLPELLPPGATAVDNERPPPPNVSLSTAKSGKPHVDVAALQKMYLAVAYLCDDPNVRKTASLRAKALGAVLEALGISR